MGGAHAVEKGARRAVRSPPGGTKWAYLSVSLYIYTYMHIRWCAVFWCDECLFLLSICTRGFLIELSLELLLSCVGILVREDGASAVRCP